MARKAKILQMEPKHVGGLEHSHEGRKVATAYGAKKKHKGSKFKQGTSGIHKDAKK